MAASDVLSTGSRTGKAARGKWPVAPAAALCAVAGIVAVLIHLVGRAPAFYHEIEGVAPDERITESKQFVRQSTEIWNEMVNEAAWSGKFRDTQVNAWLAGDFAQKHSAILPRGVSAPRVSFGDERFRLAFLKRCGPITTIISVVGQMWLPEPNLLAVEFQRVRAGAIPLPAGSVIPTLSSAARSAGWDVQWKQHRGHPVALVRLNQPQREGRVAIECVEFSSGSLRVAGRVRTDLSSIHQMADSADADSPEISANVHVPESPLRR
jgi:hypothetical protein